MTKAESRATLRWTALGSSVRIRPPHPAREQEPRDCPPATSPYVDSSVRSAYGAVIPTWSASLSIGFQQGGQQFFNGVALSNGSNSLSSSYNVGVNYNISAALLLGPKGARAARDATDADARGATEALRAAVTDDDRVVLQAAAPDNVTNSRLAPAKGHP